MCSPQPPPFFLFISPAILPGAGGAVVGFVEIYFRQPSIIIIATARLSSSFLLCLLIDGRGKAGAARVIIPDITSRTIKGDAPQHAEREDEKKEQAESSCMVSRCPSY